MLDRFKNWFQKKRTKKPLASTGPENLKKVRDKLKTLSSTISKKVPKEKVKPGLDRLKKADLAKAATVFLIVLSLYLGAELASRFISIFLPPDYSGLPMKRASKATTRTADEDYDAILRRNMFNFEREIPKPFETGLLDCMSQAKRSNQNLKLLGTIVMGSEEHSTALIQEDGNPEKIAVKKGDDFYNKYTAMSVDRQRLCFQVRSTQNFEYIEIPLKNGSSFGRSSGRGQIVTRQDGTTEVKRPFLESKLANLDEILKTARAVPYVRGGRFEGFLIQSINSDSIFAELGISQGDVLTSVNTIQLDNPGKGLEAFQQLRNSNEIELEVIRNGSKKTMKFEVN